MHILRVFNTNVVLARDAGGREVVLTGRGLGYQAHPGQKVDETKVVRTFVPEDGHTAESFGAMLATIAPEHVQLVDRVLAPVWAELRCEPSSTTVLALADHLSFAIKRVQKGVAGVFPLRAEVAHLYPRELNWARRSWRRSTPTSTLEMRLGQPITEDETAYLTLHVARLTQPGRTRRPEGNP